MSRAYYGRNGRPEHKTKLYRVWNAMKERCRNPNDRYYAIYGGRGVGVCTTWQHDFLAFKTWALQTGYGEGLMLDRIDNESGYRPDNCRWATPTEQMRNRRSNRPVIRSDDKWYPTMVAAAEDVGALKQGIYKACQGKIKTSSGYGWRYAHHHP
jgi:hypothetical protein